MLGAVLTVVLLPEVAWSAGDLHLHGSDLNTTILGFLPVWIIPFVCMLLSIAIGPLAAPHFWEHHFGKVAVSWGPAFLNPRGIVFGAEVAFYQAWHALSLD